MTKVHSLLDKLLFLLMLAFIVFHLYTSFFGVMSGVSQKGIHIGAILVIFFLGEMLKPGRRRVYCVIDFLLMAASFSSVLYLILIDDTLELRTGIIYNSDIVFGILLILVLLEATRRKVGTALAIVVSCFIAYAFLGQYLFSILKYPGITLKRFINVMYLGSEGIFGSPLYASSAYIVLFIILGAIFQETGVGQFFTDLATLGFGKYQGGPAKVAVVASGLFGSISGNSIANVISTGTFTIPLMKSVGFKPEFAGAVEAAASTGGQIMPPVMGATAFLIAEILNIPYFDLVRAAFIPALLFYVAIMITVHFNACKNDIKGVAVEDLPNKREVLSRLYLAAPLVVLLIALGVFKLTIARAGMQCIALTVVLSMFRKDTRINRERFVNIIRASVTGTMPVAIACGVVGIITGVVMTTGLGIRLSRILLDLAGGRLIVLLVLTMFCSLIMGMGVPTTAAYMTLSVLVAPALVEMGVMKIAAHLYLLYFAIISSITPPVALAAYAAAGLAKCNPTTTGFQAFKLAISGFIIPYMFIFNNYLLWDGEWYRVILALVTSIIGVGCIAGACERYFLRWHISRIECLLLFGNALLLIDASVLTDIVGFGVCGGIILFHVLRDKRQSQVAV